MCKAMREINEEFARKDAMIAGYKGEIAGYKGEIAGKDAMIAGYKDEIARLTRRIEELSAKDAEQ